MFLNIRMKTKKLMIEFYCREALLLVTSSFCHNIDLTDYFYQLNQTIKLLILNPPHLVGSDQ